MDFCIYWPGLQVTARIDMPIIAIWLPEPSRHLHRCALSFPVPPQVTLFTETMWFHMNHPGDEEAACLFRLWPWTSGLHNGLTYSNRLLKTYCALWILFCALFLFCEKNKDHSSQNPAHLSPPQSHSATLKLEAVIKTTLPPLCPSRGQGVLSQGQWVKLKTPSDMDSFC
jgi:hypothetical protein